MQLVTANLDNCIVNITMVVVWMGSTASYMFMCSPGLLVHLLFTGSHCDTDIDECILIVLVLMEQLVAIEILISMTASVLMDTLVKTALLIVIIPRPSLV